MNKPHGSKNGSNGAHSHEPIPSAGPERALDKLGPNERVLFDGKSVLFVGATGFVGKVALSMLLARYPELKKVYALVRKGSAPSAHDRFFNKILPSEPFDPIREQYGEKAAAYFAEKIHVLDGDVTDPFFGIDEKTLESLVGKVDVVVNCAGLVSFDPSLELALNVNFHGAKYGAELCLKLGAALCHVSTCFVAGNRSGLVFEDEPIAGYFPKKGEYEGRDFDLESELKDCETLIAQARARADDHALTAQFRKQARERLEEEGRDPNDDKTMRLALGRERKLWLTQELVRVGMERAKAWGWPNTYTYTKSLGEQVIARTPGLVYTIVRPSIVESALAYPFPGWNEGFTTSAPLTFMGIKGHRSFPSSETQVLDIIPVDQVAAGMLAAAGAAIKRKQKPVYQLASSDSNPFYMRRIVELVGIYKRRFYRNKKTGNETFNELMSRIEPVGVSRNFYQTLSSPGWRWAAKKAKELIDEKRPKWGAPTVDALLTRAREQLDEIEYQEATVEKVTDLFMPFVYENNYVFHCDNIRRHHSEDDGVLTATDKARLPWGPDKFEWLPYFLDIHLPGLEKWVFPGLEEERDKKVHSVRTYRDLLEMFEASVHNFKTRVAFRYYEGDRVERFSFGMVDHYSARVASFLVGEGAKKGDRVMLLSANRPEWPTTYFGILRGGLTAVPVDHQLTEREVLNLAKDCKAFALVVSEEVRERLAGIDAKLKEAGLETRVYTLAEALAGDPEVNEGRKKSPVLHVAGADDLASIIYTSGTTGTPKGVMLTHRNFTSLLSKLAGTFVLNSGDGLLSVLPLHHTFEFTCGLLLPFSRGAEINYIDELTADRLGDALEDGRITAMIGVPALFQLLHRRITQELASKPGFVESATEALMKANENLRTKRDMNFGKLLFWPVHRKFGGKIRLMVSGGSALPDDVHKAFHSLGFNIAEGYGLTESAPVLTVTEATNERKPGTVGKPLPGIEIRIADADESGIGEVIAKGPNVMAGYYGNKDATDAVLKDGWLYTGDLGKLDANGQLFLVGRKKDVIIDANGKNVYPDELEELYRESRDIKELSIVGLPDDAGGEKVACLVVPDYEASPDVEKSEVRARVEEHFRKVSSELPFYRRVKVLHVFDGVLEKTSTRKVKRKWVVEQLKGLERASQSGSKAREQAQTGDFGWLYDVVASVAQKPRGSVNRASHIVNDLGFDSLMLTELGVALENAGVALGKVEDLTQVETMADLERAVGSMPRKQAKVRRTDSDEEKPKSERDDTPEVPEALVKLGRTLVRAGQKAIYERAFDIEVSGKAYVPQNANFLVAANHTSHLDMGLIKTSLGEQGERLTALAARDYFFDTKAKRVWFENFTDLIPMDRKGSLKQSLRFAGEALKQGFNLLIFPEGTRSKDGKLHEFKPTLGYLALQQGVDVLPVFIEGAFEAMPRGSVLPKSRDLKVKIGPVVRVDAMREATKGMAKSQAYKVATKMVEDAVIALRDGKPAPKQTGVTPVERRKKPAVAPKEVANDEAAEGIENELARLASGETERETT